MVRYSEIRDSLDTGDLVLFDGRGAISTLIRYWTGNKSHIGMVVRLRDLGVMLWESTTLTVGNIHDALTGEVRKGVQLVPLSERLRLYDGRVSIRRLTATRSDDLRARLGAMREEWKGRPYERDKLSMLLQDRSGLSEDTELASLFCSELVAETYMRAGWMRRLTAANDFWPSHFADGGMAEKLLVASAALMPEMAVEYG